MIDTVKKAMLAGVGAAVVSKDKIEKALEDFVQQGKVSADEARTVAGRIAEDGRREFEQASETLGAKLKELTARDSKEMAARVEALEARIRVLEAKAAATTPAAGAS